MAEREDWDRPYFECNDLDKPGSIILLSSGCTHASVANSKVDLSGSRNGLQVYEGSSENDRNSCRRSKFTFTQFENELYKKNTSELFDEYLKHAAGMFTTLHCSAPPRNGGELGLYQTLMEQDSWCRSIHTRRVSVHPWVVSVMILCVLRVSSFLMKTLVPHAAFLYVTIHKGMCPPN